MEEGLPIIMALETIENGKSSFVYITFRRFLYQVYLLI